MPARLHLTIGEVLSLLREEFPDVSISKIRFLESQGLVDPERTPSGYRKFYEQDVERLRWILLQQKEHFLPLKVIRDRLDSDGELQEGARSPAGVGADIESDAPAPDVTTPAAPDPDAPDPDAPAADAGRPAGLAADGTGSPGRPDPAEHTRDRAQPASTWSGRPGTGRAAVARPGSDRPGGPGRAPAGGRPEAVSPHPDGGALDRARRVPDPAGGPGQGAAAAGPTHPGIAPAASDGPQVAAAGPDPGRQAAHPGAGAASGAAPARPTGPDPVTAAPGPSGAAPPTARPGREVPSDPAPALSPPGRGRAGRSPGAVPAAEDRRAAAEQVRARTTADTGPGGDGEPEVYTATEVAETAGTTLSLVRELEQYGIVKPGASVGGVAYFDANAVALARIGARLAELGVEPRHLRPWRNSADREVGLFEQLVMPLLRQRNSDSRRDGADRLAELIELGADLRAGLVADAVRAIR